MADFGFGSYDVGDHTYWMTTGNLTGAESVIAVTDEENDIHYISDELGTASEAIEASETVPDEYGNPDQVVAGVDVHRMDDIARYIREDKKEGLERSLANLGNDILGPDSQRERPEGKSSRQAQRKMEMYDFEASPQDHL